MNKKLKKLFLCFAAILCLGSLTNQNVVTAQQKHSLTGTVLDGTGQSVIGANVFVVGSTDKGVVTDVDGKFSLNVPVGATIRISFIGMKSQDVVVGTQQNIQVVLEEEAQKVDELVVVGFVKQKRSNVAGAVSQVKMDDVLGERPVTALGSALQGAMPGFTASASVVPGGGNSFNIRGTNSINGGSPLVLVDNVPYNDLNLLNPSDIESVSILKDASSAAIYGARASFGVILITTKQGRKNETLSINYNNNFAFSKVTNLPSLASPYDMIKTLQDGGYTSIWSGQNISTYLPLLEDYKTNPAQYPEGWTTVNGTKYFLRENDIQGEMFETSFKQTHNVSAEGGSERINYRLSLGYTTENGILVTNKDSFRRISVSSYVNGDITKWLSTSLDFKYNTGKTQYPTLDGASEMGIWKTNLPSYHPVGSLPYADTDDIYLVQTPKNVIEQTNASKTITDDTRIFSRTVLKPLEGLEGVLEIAHQFSNSDYETYPNYFQLHQGLAENIKNSTTTRPFTTWRSSTKYTTLNAYATYNKTLWNDHNISLIAGFNQEYNNYRYVYAQSYNMISDDTPFLGGGDGSTPPSVADSYNQYALRGGFFRAGYNYQQRYFLEFNGRYDLSSKFRHDNRSLFSPSFSAAWNIHKEKFMASTSNIISNLKLRASYGSLGNQNIGNYGYYATMSPYEAGWIYNAMQPTSLGTPGMVRGNYTWETVKTINGGIDFGLLQNRLTGSFDIYQRKTLDMLGPSREFPSVAGASAPTSNSADMKTYGWELSLNWRDKIGKDINYGIGFNIYDYHSFITRYRNESNTLSASYYVGQRIGEIWGYVTDGFYTADDFETTGALKSGVVSIQGVTSHEGDIKYKNLRDDDASTNVINTGDNTKDNPGDRKVIGNNQARYQYGINGFLEWKGLQFSFILQGVGKRDAWIGGNIIFPMSDQYGTVYSDQVGKIWTPTNTNAYYGRIYENAGSSQGANQRVSDKFLSDASYLRVKNITISYQIPQNWIQKIGLRGAKVFFSGENLFTFDNLPDGIDPENLGWTYPHYKTYSFGINLNL